MSIGNWEPKKRNTPYKPNDRFQQRRIYEDNNRLRSENEELRQRLNYLEARLQGSILSQHALFLKYQIFISEVSTALQNGRNLGGQTGRPTHQRKDSLVGRSSGEIFVWPFFRSIGNF